VLSTPPAFVLSQDQTLRQRSSRFFDTSTDGGRGEEFALIWTRCPRGHRGSPSSPRRARRGWTAPGSNLAPMCWLIRSPDVPSTVALGQRTPGRARCACPVVTGFRALAFHTLLSFQGASWNRPATLLVVPLAGPVAGAAATLLWAFQVRQPSDLSPGSSGDTHRFAHLYPSVGA
jgi:hypothetical protein